jgi:hypothetical protein
MRRPWGPLPRVRRPAANSTSGHHSLVGRLTKAPPAPLFYVLRVGPARLERVACAPYAGAEAHGGAGTARRVGGAKRYYEEMTEGGLNLFAAEGKFVCADCFTDDALRRAVREMASNVECSFCGATGSKPIAVPLEYLVRHVEVCILGHYDDAAACLPYDGREGGYQGGTFDTWDVVEEVELEAALADEADELLETIRDALGDRTWCERDPFALREHQRLFFSWEYFAEFIKHERRFFFLGARPPYAERDGADEFLAPADMLATIVAQCRCHDLLVPIAAGTRLFRAREQEPGPPFAAPLDLGAPPPARAKQNRMSPAGIVMTYLAEDEHTALAETVPPDGSAIGKVFAVGEFETTRELTLLDLTAVPEVPSIFDRERASERDAIIFLRRFVAELAKRYRARRSHPRRVHPDPGRHGVLPNGARPRGRGSLRHEVPERAAHWRELRGALRRTGAPSPVSRRARYARPAGATPAR